MQVVHFIDTGASSAFLRDYAALGSRQAQLTIGTLREEGPLHREMSRLGVRSFSLGTAARGAYPRSVLSLARTLRQLRARIIHTHLVEASLVGLMAGRLAGCLCIQTRHHSDLNRLSGAHKGLAADWLIGHALAHRIVAPSSAVVRALTDIDRVPRCKITQIPYGFDWSRIRPKGAAGATRQALGLDRELVFVAVGRLDRLKGHDVLIRAFAEFRPRLVGAVLLIVGTGPYERVLKGLAKDLNVAEHCRFLGYRSDVFDLIHSGDLVVHPSLSEAQNQVIIEGLALGKPVVATAVGAADEVVVPGETGWLVPPGNPEELLRALNEARSKRPLLQKMGAKGRELVQSKYPIERMVKQYHSLYEPSN